MKKMLFAVILLVSCISTSVNAGILSPDDAIWGIQVNGSIIEVGVEGMISGTNNWPGFETPRNAIDGVGQKYLNFGEEGTGLIVTPNVGISIATSFTVWSANDEVPRDPSSYQLWGTIMPIAGPGPFSLSDFLLISAGDLTLPSSRNLGGNDPLFPWNSQTVGFANSNAYSSYLFVFPDVKDPFSANSMQIAEVQLDGIIGSVPVPASVWLLGSGLIGLVGFRRKTRKT